MSVVGLITEYNPFHKGHEYHIEKAKELTGASGALVVMSGNYVQRGTPAFLDKYSRTTIALNHGADLVFELPLPFSCSSAEYFALSAVTILNKTGIVDYICFGAETDDLSTLEKIAKALIDAKNNEEHSLNIIIKDILKTGVNYASARSQAICKYFNDSTIESIISMPNNILAIEYLKAIYRLNSKIKPYTIQRISSQYHDVDLQEEFSSATALRQTISNGNFSNLSGQIPSNCMTLLEAHYQTRYPIYTNDFSLLLKYRLLNETKTSLTQYADVSEELANRICNQLNNFV